MKKIAFALMSCCALSACLAEAWNGTGTQIGQVNGVALYESSCTVQLRLVGRTAQFGPNRGNPVTEYYACEPQARTTCDGGFTVRDVDQGPTRMETFVSGDQFHTVRETVRVRTVKLQYTCAA